MGKTIKIYPAFLKCVTKTCTNVVENVKMWKCWKCAIKSYITEIFPGTIQSESSQKWNLHQEILQIIQLYWELKPFQYPHKIGDKKSLMWHKICFWIILSKIVETLGRIEAATVGVLLDNVFSENSQNSQENTCVRVSFLINLQAWDSGTCVFLWILRNF